MASGELNADGTTEVIVAPNGDMDPRVRVFARWGELLSEFLVYPSGFRGGVRVATGNLNGEDPVEDLIVAPGPGGGPHIKTFYAPPGATAPALEVEWMAYSKGFRGGVFVGAANMDGEPDDEVITAADTGGGPHVRVWKVAPEDGTVRLLTEWFAYSTSFTGGVRVAGNGDYLFTGPGPGGGPHVRAWKPTGGKPTPGPSFMAYNKAFRGGVFVGGILGASYLVVGPDQGGGPHIKTYYDTNLNPLAEWMAYNPAFTGGVRVAGYSDES